MWNKSLWPISSFCDLSGITIFFHITSLTDTIFRKMLLNINCEFWFSLQLSSETFLLLRWTQRSNIIKAHLQRLWLHHIFPHYLINGAIFGKKSLDIKCIFRFSLHLLFETFLILRRTQRDIVINVKKFSCTKYPLFLLHFNEIWHLNRLSKTQKYQISWKSVQWEPSCFMRTDRQTEIHDEVNSRFSQFSERASVYDAAVQLHQRHSPSEIQGVYNRPRAQVYYVYCVPVFLELIGWSRWMYQSLL
jgi:hypothetical protein